MCCRIKTLSCVDVGIESIRMVRNTDQTDIRIDDGNCVEDTLPLDDGASEVRKVYLAVRKPVEGALFIEKWCETER